MQVNVINGTNAGWRRTSSDKPRDWTCSSCKARLRYYWVKCPNDGTHRDEA